MTEKAQKRTSKSEDVKDETSSLDVNMYATKKSVAQGMMDIALLTSNAAQLKYVLKSPDLDAMGYLNVGCIGFSIVLQLVVGTLLVFVTRYNINDTAHHQKAELLNNFTTVGIFMITIVNVLSSAFTGNGSF